MIGNGLVSKVAKSPREERNLGDQTLVIVITLEMKAKQLIWIIVKDEMASEAKRSLDKSSEGLEKVFPGEAGK
ncbi:hypothetical protein Tco_0340168 [Tanacetum coccineum]